MVCKHVDVGEQVVEHAAHAVHQPVAGLRWHAAAVGHAADAFDHALVGQRNGLQRLDDGYLEHDFTTALSCTVHNTANRVL